MNQPYSGIFRLIYCMSLDFNFNILYKSLYNMLLRVTQSWKMKHNNWISYVVYQTFLTIARNSYWIAYWKKFCEPCMTYYEDKILNKLPLIALIILNIYTMGAFIWCTYIMILQIQLMLHKLYTLLPKYIINIFHRIVRFNYLNSKYPTFNSI